MHHFDTTKNRRIAEVPTRPSQLVRLASVATQLRTEHSLAEVRSGTGMRDTPPGG